jgi:hypothetical protein
MPFAGEVVVAIVVATARCIWVATFAQFKSESLISHKWVHFWMIYLSLENRLLAEWFS